MLENLKYLKNYIKLKRKYPLNKEQIDFFNMRQKRHEQYVKEAADKLLKGIRYEYIVNPSNLEEFEKSIKTHDKSKWKYPEYFPYVWLTSVYNLNYKWPDEELKELSDEAWEHHYLNNPHHPEYWKYKYNLDCMNVSDIMHMVCDWAAMSREFNNGLLDWYENKASKRFKFSDLQDYYIRKFISILEPKKGE